MGGSPEVSNRGVEKDFSQLKLTLLPGTTEEVSRNSEMSQTNNMKNIKRNMITPTLQSTRSSTNIEKIDVMEVHKMMESFKHVLKQEKPLEMALAMLEGI
jgi:hypothetical protein